MTQLLFWGHAIAALFFAALAAWQVDHWRDRVARAVAIACAAMAVWSGVTAWVGPAAPAAQLAESARNLAWLVFLHALLRRGGSPYRSLRALYAALAFVVCANGVIDLLALLGPAAEARSELVLLPLFAMRMIFAVGALVAVQNLYAATAAGARAGVGLPLTVLGLLWAVDLTFYALCWAQGGWAVEFAVARGGVAMMLAPMVALSARRNTRWTIRLSRTVAFRSIGLIAALGYLGLVIVSAYALREFGGAYANAVPPVVLMAAALAAALTMSSPRARAWSSVMLSKHLFAHRYDYRAEWLRFTGTLGIPGPEAAPLDVRVVKAIADIVQAPGGMLLMPTGEVMTAGARWQWSTLSPPNDVGDARLAALLASGRIVELDVLRGGSGDAGEASAIPEWIMADASAFAIVPLVHVDRLTGAVLLERPLVTRALDWEDFDLLRLAGRQVASYLAEANAQDALGEATRFDEFNRRFAFIMHDIKNLVSQLTLVTRNAERHADKPEFRADMIATLQSSTARMNDLLARLSQHNTGRVEDPVPLQLQLFVARIAEQFRKRHPLVIVSNGTSTGLADPGRLEQALSHLVQNAIDASGPTDPVTLTLVERDGEVGIEVWDNGPGMTAEFVAAMLFKPFASTKAGGFGVGAHEARTLVNAMRGRISVVSVPGEGTKITVWLPAAAPKATAQMTRRAA
ncbi:MAG: XrtA/PEP-CTERM system histidine kinase PrsK [Sphingomonadales bacterium]